MSSDLGDIIAFETATAKESELKGKVEDQKEDWQDKKFVQPGHAQKRLLENNYAIRRKNR